MFNNNVEKESGYGYFLSALTEKILAFL